MATLERDRAKVPRSVPDEASREHLIWYLRGLVEHLGDLLARGAIAGFAAGLAFLLANMGYATTQGKPAVAPLMDISTIFHGSDQPASMTPTSDMIATGLVTHTALSIVFGMVFALLVPFLRNLLMLTVGGVVFGLAVYLVNFQVLGNTVFEWFTNPKGPDQWFELLIHGAFGLMLVPFFIGVGRRLVPRTP
jgi:hypothetical protein